MIADLFSQPRTWFYVGGGLGQRTGRSLGENQASSRALNGRELAREPAPDRRLADRACHPGRGERGGVLHQLPGPAAAQRGDGRQDPIEHRVGDLGQDPGPPDVVARRPHAVSGARSGFCQRRSVSVFRPEGPSRRLEQVVRVAAVRSPGWGMPCSCPEYAAVHERAGDQAQHPARLRSPGQPPRSLRTSGTHRAHPTGPVNRQFPAPRPGLPSGTRRRPAGSSSSLAADRRQAPTQASPAAANRRGSDRPPGRPGVDFQAGRGPIRSPCGSPRPGWPGDWAWRRSAAGGTTGRERGCRCHHRAWSWGTLLFYRAGRVGPDRPLVRSEHGGSPGWPPSRVSA